MDSGPCNGPSKGAPDSTGGILNISRSESGGCMRHVLFASDGLSGSVVRE